MAPDTVYVYVSPEDVSVDITLCGGITDYDTKLLVFEDECYNYLPMACNEDACTAPNLPYPFASELRDVQFLAGHTYYIVVDGYPNYYGHFTLSITRVDPIPAVSERGMVAMALLMLTAGTLVYARHRPAQT